MYRFFIVFFVLGSINVICKPEKSVIRGKKTKQTKQTKQYEEDLEAERTACKPKFCFKTRPLVTRLCLLLQNSILAGSLGPFQGTMFFCGKDILYVAGTVDCSVTDLESECS